MPAGRAASAPVLVVAPGHAHRTLRHPVATGLGAAGLGAGADAPSGPAARRADVPASVALTLLCAAGVTAAVDVVELPRDPGGDAPDARGVPDVPAGVVLLVVVGSPSARHGDAAPLAEDPRAADADAALLAGLAG
ncbi:hypothetical protein AAHH18_18250, partial [Cellulomonas sp. P4]|uniref:hypothetical protein n=1 Tax=Cellulomonas sp. P4 TaxID=3142533 RepID=UPI0031B9DB43